MQLQLERERERESLRAMKGESSRTSAKMRRAALEEIWDGMKDGGYSIALARCYLISAKSRARMIEFEELCCIRFDS